MSSTNPLNVYTGPSSLKDYHDPELQPLLPLVEIPESLNPFAEHGVRIYAKMMTMLPAHNVKALPALNMLSKCVTPETKTIIEYSSGSTVLSMSILARIVHGVGDTRAFLSNKTSEAKIQLMRFFGLDITLFGGPSQPEPLDERGGIQKARMQAAEQPEVVNPNQYENDANWQSHFRWTGPQILKQLPSINIVCAGLGTSGTMTGIGAFFKMAKPSVVPVAVCTAPGDRVPGPRSYSLLSPVKFPWSDAVDVIEEVGSMDSYLLSMKLSREGLICGPSSGFNLQGLYQMLEKRKSAGTLEELRNDDGSIHCVFLCCDLPYQYMSEYFTKLGESSFPPVKNKNLSKVDLYRYDEAWELEVPEALSRVLSFPYNAASCSKPSLSPSLGIPPGITKPSSSPGADMILLDLRKNDDFRAWRLPLSINLPLESLNSDTCSPFEDPSMLEKQWLELESLFKDVSASNHLKNDHSIRDHQVLVVCYDGDTSRVATSILREKGIEAFSVRHGTRGMLLRSPELQDTYAEKVWTRELFNVDTGASSVDMGAMA